MLGSCPQRMTGLLARATDPSSLILGCASEVRCPFLARRVEQECGHDRFASGADVRAALVTQAGHLDRRFLSSKRPTFRSFRR